MLVKSLACCCAHAFRNPPSHLLAAAPLTPLLLRAGAGNLVANSSFVLLPGVRLYPVPSSVRDLAAAALPASASGLALSWRAPADGTGDWPPAAGNGFAYRLELSDDGGVTFHEVMPRPAAVQSGHDALIQSGHDTLVRSGCDTPVLCMLDGRGWPCRRAT
jgi:hypothetical protein